MDKLAQSGKANINFPSAAINDSSLDFSFSGIKTAVINLLHTAGQRGERIKACDVAASFQHTAVQHLLRRLFEAADEYKVKAVAICGGVSANGALRSTAEEMAKMRGLELYIPPMWLCTDNAAMIGAAAVVAIRAGEFMGLETNANPGMRI